MTRKPRPEAGASTCWATVAPYENLLMVLALSAVAVQAGCQSSALSYRGKDSGTDSLPAGGSTTGGNGGGENAGRADSAVAGNVGAGAGGAGGRTETTGADSGAGIGSGGREGTGGATSVGGNADLRRDAGENADLDRGTGGNADLESGGSTSNGGTISSGGAGGLVVGGSGGFAGFPGGGAGGPAPGGAGGFAGFPGGGAGGNGGTGGNNWTDPNCYMRCGQGNAVYYHGGNGYGGMGGLGGVGPGGGGGGGSADASPGSGADGATNECSIALPLKCGDQWNHSTLVQGRPDVWNGYSRTQRSESGPETIYVFRPDAACQVVAQLGNLTTDLDLLLLTACGPGSNTAAASTPLDLQTVETIRFSTEAGNTYYLVVDGYAGAAGTYTLQVDCTCN